MKTFRRSSVRNGRIGGLILALAMVCALPAFANPTHWAGEDNGWNAGSDSMGSALSGWRTYTRYFGSGVSSANDEFKFTNGTWTHNWSRSATITFGAQETLGYNWGANTVLPTDGSAAYYTFRVQDVADGASGVFGVQKTSYNPASITRGAATSPSATTLKVGQALKVTGNFGGDGLDSGEHAYIRATEDNWSNSWFVEFTGGTATQRDAVLVFGNPATSANAHYYLLTSSYDDANIGTNTDVRTLRWDTNGGSNWDLTIEQVNWDKMWLRGDDTAISSGVQMIKEPDATGASKSFYYVFPAQTTDAAMAYEMCGGGPGDTTPDWNDPARRYGDIGSAYAEGTNRALLGTSTQGVTNLLGGATTSGATYIAWVRTGDTYAAGDRKYGLSQISSYGMKITGGVYSYSMDAMTYEGATGLYYRNYALAAGTTYYFKFFPNAQTNDPAGFQWCVGPDNASANTALTVGAPFTTASIGIDSWNLTLTPSVSGNYLFTIHPETWQIVVSLVGANTGETSHFYSESSGWTHEALGAAVSGWRTFTKRLTVSDANDEYKISQGTSLTPWGYNSADHEITPGALETAHAFGAYNLLLPDDASARYYTLRVKNTTLGNNALYVVNKTDYEPADVTFDSASPTTDALVGQMFYIHADFSGDGLDSGEYGYIRYTTDSWSTSSIEPLDAGTATDRYRGFLFHEPVSSGEFYLLTSTYTTDTLAGGSQDELDGRTLRWDVNGGANYDFRVSQPQWARMWIAGEDTALAAGLPMKREGDAGATATSFYAPFQAQDTDADMMFALCGGQSGDLTPNFSDPARRYGDVAPYVAGTSRGVLGTGLQGVGYMGGISITQDAYYIAWFRVGDTVANGDRKYGIAPVTSFGMKSTMNTFAMAAMDWDAGDGVYLLEYPLAASGTYYFSFYPNQSENDPMGRFWGVGATGAANEEVTVGTPFSAGVGVDAWNLYVTPAVSGDYRFTINPATWEVRVTLIGEATGRSTHLAGEMTSPAWSHESLGAAEGGWRTFSKRFTADAASNEFKITQNAWLQEWGVDGAANPIAFGEPYTAQTSYGNFELPADAAAAWYTWRVQDVAAGNPATVGVLKTAYEPAAIAQAASAPATDTLRVGQALKVTANFGGDGLEAGENAYVRMAVDGDWNADRFIPFEATGPLTAQAILVPGPDSNPNPASVSYYLLTSPYTSATLDLDASKVDVRTLRWDVNGGANFTKTLAQVNWAKMWMRGTGPLAGEFLMVKEPDAAGASKSFWLPLRAASSGAATYEFCGGEAAHAAPDWASDSRRYGDIVADYTEGVNRAVLGAFAEVLMMGPVALEADAYYIAYIRTGDTYLAGDRKYGVKKITSFSLQYGPDPGAPIGEFEPSQAMTFNAATGAWEYTAPLAAGTYLFRFLPNGQWRDPSGHEWGFGPNAAANEPVFPGVWHNVSPGVESYNLSVTITTADEYIFSVRPDTLEAKVEVKPISSVDHWTLF